MNLEKLYVGQKTYDKTRLGFVREKLSLVTKNTGSRKEKGEHFKKSENKRKNVENIKDNKIQYNHAYQYKYTHRKNMNRHHHHRDRDTFNSNWLNKIYFRCSDS
jgi:hypothetical protein